MSDESKNKFIIGDNSHFVPMWQEIDPKKHINIHFENDDVIIAYPSSKKISLNVTLEKIDLVLKKIDEINSKKSV